MRAEDLKPYPAAHVERLTAAGWWRPETLTDWLNHHAARRPAVAALIGAETITYESLAHRAAELASGFRALGLASGDVVAVQLPNSAAFLTVYLALQRLGCVMQTLHMPYRAAEIGALTTHSQAKAIICTPTFRDYPIAAHALEVARASSSLKHVIVAGDGIDGATRLNDVAAAAADRLPPTPPATAPALLLYTSGTTTSPKGVAVDHRPFTNNARLSAIEFAVTQADIVTSAAPFSHLYGLFSFHLALAAGAATAPLPAFTPPDFAALLRTARPTMIFTAPAHCAALLRAGTLTRADMASVRHLIISGSTCPPEVAEGIAALLPEGAVHQLWGMTEIQAGAYTRPGDPPSVRHRSIGRASPGNAIRVADSDGRALRPGEEGELQVRGASVFGGYYANEDANHAAFTPEGWFRTGDLARLDLEGNIAITGRLKDVINRGGVKFNPADVESAIATMPSVALCAMVSYPDAVLGERACVFVQPAPGAAISLAAIQAHLEARGIAKIKWPERLELVETMPLTPTNKVIKGRLRVPI